MKRAKSAKQAKAASTRQKNSAKPAKRIIQTKKSVAKKVRRASSHSRRSTSPAYIGQQSRQESREESKRIDQSRAPKSSRSLRSLRSLASTAQPKIRTISDEKLLFTKAAKRIADELTLAIAKKGFATIALAGGRSAASLCAKLAKQKISWKDIHVFVIDERLVPINDEQSNFKIINDTLVRPINAVKPLDRLPRANVHPFIFDSLVPDEGSAHYSDELSQVTAGTDTTFDIIFVSAGEDGHIAGLYPHHPLLSNKAAGFATFHDSPKPPADRMTALPHNFLHANFSLLLIIGDTKRQALVNLKNTSMTLKDCPAKLVTKSHDHLILTNLKATD